MTNVTINGINHTLPFSWAHIQRIHPNARLNWTNY